MQTVNPLDEIREEMADLLTGLSLSNAQLVLELARTVYRNQGGGEFKDYDPNQDPAIGLLNDFADRFPPDLAEHTEDYLYGQPSPIASTEDHQP